MKVFLSGVTALLMLCAVDTTARGQGLPPGSKNIVDVPLTHALPPGLGPCEIDHVALSSQTGFRVRPPLAADRPWTVRVVAAEEQLTVTLHRPDGGAVASKQLVADQRPCRALVELVAVLLSAYVPEVVLRAPPGPAPTTQPLPATLPSSSPETRPTAAAASTAQTDPELPPMPTVAAPLRTIGHWYAGVGGGVTGFSEGPAALGMLRGHLQLWRHLAAGAQALVSYHNPDVASGEASIWAVDGRLTAGVLLRHRRLAWSAGGLVGARLTHAAAKDLYRSSSSSVGAVSLGLCGDMWWAAGRHLRLGLGTNVVFFLPRAAFEVQGVGQVYETPLPTVEIHLSVGLES